MSEAVSLPRHSRMGWALICSNLLSEPLFTLYGFLTFILYKDLGASPFHITLLTMLKPLVTILSFYWSAGLQGRSRKLKSNVMWAGFWMRAPFLLVPWFDSIGYVIAAGVNYMFFYRAGIPAWLEMLKRGMPEGKRGKIFALSAALGYGEGVMISLAMGGLLDQDPGLWKGLFFAAAAIGLLAVWVQGRVRIESEEETEVRAVSWREVLVRPWRDSYRLMKERKDFSRFQWGFMLCGFGIMMIQPAIPLFAVDWLGVSYLEMAAAVSIAKGLGYVLSTPLWAKWIDRRNVFWLASAVFLSVGLFPILLSVSTWGLVWFYVAYFWYGVGQGGSHLVWNLSGPIFAGKEESSRYSGVNVVLAGLRGGVAPPLGGWLAVVWGPVGVLILGGLLSFYSGLSLLRGRFKEKVSA